MIGTLYAQWCALPENVRAGIKNALSSLALTVNTLVGTTIAFAAAADPPAADTWDHFSAYLSKHWFALAVALLYGGGTAGALRAKQGSDTAKTLATAKGQTP